MEKGLKLSDKTDSKASNESMYRQLVENLIYLATTMPGLSYIVSFHFHINNSAKGKALDCNEEGVEICETDN